MNIDEYGELLKEGGVLVVDFYADWCNPCKMLKPFLVNACRNSGANLVMVNIEDENSQGLVSLFGVRSIPFVARIENGNVTETMSGYMGENYVNRFVEGLEQEQE